MHSSWTICNPLHQFCPQILSKLWISSRHVSAWGIQTGSFAVPWAYLSSNILQLLNFIKKCRCLGHSNWPICRTLSLFYPRILWNLWIIFRHISAWGIQTGPFAALWANFVFKLFKLVNFIRVSKCLGHSNWPICSILSQFCSQIWFNLWISFRYIKLGAFKLA